MWRRLDGTELNKSLEDTILEDVSRTDSPLNFYIGADSHFSHKKNIYSVVLVMLKEGKGGIGYYSRNTEKGFITTQQRLFQETYYAVELAVRINPLLESIGHSVKEIHTDLNPDPNFLSSTMINQCLGYIKGMGFKGITKPYSWAASSVADVKSK